MRKIGLLSLLFTSKLLFANSGFHDMTAKTLGGKDLKFSEYKGKVVLVVNIASKCGYTPQLKGLQELQTKHKSEGFEVLGFPSNSFRQEPLAGEKISNFCKLNYGVDFTIFRKSDVKGKTKHPVFAFLTDHSKNKKEVSWNFEKFLVGRDGQVVGRYASSVSPDDSGLVKDIGLALAAAKVRKTN